MTTESLKSIVKTGCNAFAVTAFVVFSDVTSGRLTIREDQMGKSIVLNDTMHRLLNSALRMCAILNPGERFNTDDLPDGFVEALASKDLIFDEAQSQNGLIVVTKKGCDYRLEFWYGKYLQ